MAKVKIQGHASGTGILTVTAPNTSTDRTITLPDATGTLLNSDGSGASLTSLPNQKVNSNLIINGDFAVSQRGDYTSATSASDSAYYLDRWGVASGGVTHTIQDTGFAAKLVATSTATGSMRHRQKFEEMSYLSGKTVTISCQMKSNDANSRINVYADGWQSTTATHTGGGDWETISITLTIPAGVTTELSAHFGIDGVSSADVTVTSGDYCEIKEVKMELGSVATDFEHRSFGEELALCQRYYYAHSDTAGQCVGGAGGFARANNQVRTALVFPVTMRSSPSLSAGSGTNYYKFENGSGNIYATTLGITNTNNKATEITASVSGATMGDARTFALASSSAYVTFDSEL
jgi:hypothetical protein